MWRWVGVSLPRTTGSREPQPIQQGMGWEFRSRGRCLLMSITHDREADHLIACILATSKYHATGFKIIAVLPPALERSSLVMSIFLQPKPKGHILSLNLSVLGLLWVLVALRQAEGIGVGRGNPGPCS